MAESALAVSDECKNEYSMRIESSVSCEPSNLIAEVNVAKHKEETAEQTVKEDPAKQRNAKLLASSLLQNPNKAGTGGRSKDEINAIILAASKMERLGKEIQELQERAAEFSAEDIAASAFVVTKMVEVQEEKRDLSRTIVHIDMDAFYASVEILDRPDLKEKPMAVGGPKSGGTLCTANYEARKYGVRSAMATHIALALCPELIILRPDFPKYQKKAELIRAVFAVSDQK
ncbi:hypothetical protein HK100_001802 [Physocladia obscura]|uniref:UmuC domain-containing protein n=1 Tax=Physocladia obscura TaxID=109957 RepID=A0AAD5XK54_9FUNG|nr:hypothetical protein HK100_001802 [Physocladia obscura]